MLLRTCSVLLLAACSSLPSADPAGAPPAAPPTRAELAALPMFDGESRARVAFADLERAVDGADIVVLAELHGHPLGLPLHQALFEEALARHPGAALCLEFLPRDTQHLVDAYLTDLLTLDELDAALAHIRGASAKDHAPLLRAAMATGTPVIAANAPRLYTTLVREQGFAALEELTPHQHTLFDAPAGLPTGPYRERFFDTMAPMFAPGGVHGEEREGAPSALEAGAGTETSEASGEDTGAHDVATAPARIQSEQATATEPPVEPPIEDRLAPETREQILGMLRAQSLWDATMAASVARQLEAGRSPVFLVVGSFHTNHDGGTLQELRARAPGARIVTIAFEDTDAPELRDTDHGIADFVVYAGSFPD